ncbi:MarR family transcriptional regulator [Pseudorhodoferax aquiterrae]|uniref:MarR family transcriptional regulator n=1 Tax=Pseudorhodoferax aquiterrae TaxID=747304 RepID=A0ABQ3FWZ6_9BURK|nr:MarR family transcriptional regulator [Pseudorhodoferax aquiterrae]GHC70890.1 MarR family transcriptional regulator [Pseudorhodoferax aquiterrae]
MSNQAPSLPPERETALMATTMLLSVLQRAYKSTADKAVAHHGVSATMAWPLVMIGRQGDGVRQVQLAELLGIEAASLVRSLDQLVAAGLAQRREDPADRRAKTLHLTPAGATARAQIEATLHDLRASLFEGVPDEDVAACLRVFATLEQRLGCVMPSRAPASTHRSAP